MIVDTFPNQDKRQNISGENSNRENVSIGNAGGDKFCERNNNYGRNTGGKNADKKNVSTRNAGE